jgi:hypothetical protein
VGLIFHQNKNKNKNLVWDNCGVSNSCNLERLQLEAARIITGLPIFTNTEYLYRETGWERLEERRTRRKLQLFLNCGLPF